MALTVVKVRLLLLLLHTGYFFVPMMSKISSRMAEAENITRFLAEMVELG